MAVDFESKGGWIDEYNVVMRWNMLVFRRWDDYFSVFCAVEVAKWGVRVQKAGSHSDVAARCGADVQAGGAPHRTEGGGADLILSVDFTWGGYSDEKRRKTKNFVAPDKYVPEPLVIKVLISYLCIHELRSKNKHRGFVPQNCTTHRRKSGTYCHVCQSRRGVH